MLNYQIFHSSFEKISQYFHGDLPTHHPDEYDQPGHQLHQGCRQVRHDLRHQHHLHDGPGLHLPLGVRQSAHHLGHQASGGLAPVQPGLPSYCDADKYRTSGKV